MGALLIAAAAAIALGTAAAAGTRTLRAGLSVQAAGCAALAVVGFWAVATGRSAGAGFTSQFAPRLGIDGVSGFFLAVLGVAAAPTLVYSTAYLGSGGLDRVEGVLSGGFVLTMAAVLTARDPVSFLGAWELMTLLPAAALVVHHRADDRSRRTAFVYVAMTHLGGAGTWVAVLLLARAHAFGAAGAIHAGSGLQLAVAVTALVGMGTKAGLMPLHSWLPRAHPLAPAPVSALMSGVMLKVAVYGLVRVLVCWDGVLPRWFGVVVLAAGAVSAVGGIGRALVERHLKRLLALSSIDNMGITALGLGACLLMRSDGDGLWAAVALGALLLHSLNHAAFKSLLFLASGSVEKSARSLDLDRLGGVLRSMPYTGSAMLVGCVAICGLPPLNGFASEWLTLRALLHLAAAPGDGLVGAAAVAALGLTAALAVFCFVKVVGLSLLGRPRTRASREAREVAPPMRWAVVGLAAVCLALGAFPGLVVGHLVALAPWAEGTGLPFAPGISGVGSDLPAPILAASVVVLTVVLSRLRVAGSTEPARSPTWACGQEVVPQLEWTSAGFSEPAVLVAGPLLGARSETSTSTVRSGGVVSAGFSRTFRDPLEDLVLRPLARRALATARFARRLQSGHIGAYAGYLVALVLLVLAAGRLGWIG